MANNTTKKTETAKTKTTAKNSKTKAKKENKQNLIIGICVAAAAVIAVIIAIVLIINNNNTLNDSYFKSDDTKYVLSVDAEELSFDEDKLHYVPVKAHVVYTYSGDEITGMKTYAEYADASTAEKAFKEFKDSDEADEMKNAELNGKYIIVTNESSQYEGMTASDVKKQIEFYESIKNMDLGDDDVENTDTIEDIEETTEE